MSAKRFFADTGLAQRDKKQLNEQSMKKRSRQFGKKESTTATETSPKLQAVLSNMYLSIQKLPLHRFIDCIVDGNLHSLIISGAPSIIELQITWGNILQEYSQAIGNNEYRLYTSLYKEIALIKITYDQIGEAVKILRIVHSEYFHKELNKLLKTDFKLNPNDQASYQEELSKALRRSRSLIIKHDLKKLQFEAIQKKQEGKGGKFTREYFVSILITLSDYAKYPIQDTITVSEYCERIKRFNIYLDALEPIKKKRA